MFPSATVGNTLFMAVVPTTQFIGGDFEVPSYTKLQNMPINSRELASVPSSSYTRYLISMQPCLIIVKRWLGTTVRISTASRQELPFRFPQPILWILELGLCHHNLTIHQWKNSEQPRLSLDSLQGSIPTLSNRTFLFTVWQVDHIRWNPFHSQPFFLSLHEPLVSGLKIIFISP